MSKTILRVDGSMNTHNSTSRMLTDKLIEQIKTQQESEVITRDLAQGVAFIDQDWIAANFTDPSERSLEQKEKLAESDVLVNEMKQANILIMSVPIYNFGVPAAFKAWIDMVARARETFQYTEKGPVGLLEMERCFLIITSGGTPVGSDLDFVSNYIKLLLSFLGISQVEVIACDGMMTEGQAVVEKALDQIQKI